MFCSIKLIVIKYKSRRDKNPIFELKMNSNTQPTEQEIRKNFNLKTHHQLEGVKSCNSADKAQQEIDRIIAEAEAEGYECKVRRVGNQIHIDKQKKNSEKIIDGHFWVEYKGKNIDLTMDQTAERIKRNGHRLVYLPVSVEDGLGFFNYQMEETKKRHLAKGYIWEEWLEDAIQNYENGLLGDFDCLQGAVVLKHKYGDEATIRYGQIGALKPDGKIYWYFGHPDEPKEMWEKTQGSTDYIRTETEPSRHPNLIYDPRTPPKSKKQGRNDKCLCGSGKKFKVCCGKNYKK